jgi:hypothetical protein
MSVALRLVLTPGVLHPATFQTPPAAVQDPVRRAQAVLAFALDPALPSIPLEVWIGQVVGTSAGYQWASGACAGARERHNPALPLCVVVVASTRDVAVTVSIRVGEFMPDPESRRWEGSHRWHAPRFDDAFIERGGHSLMLERLSDLPRMLALAPHLWPQPDVRLEATRCAPADPMPHQPVTCSVVVANRGQATAHARVFVDAETEAHLGGESLVRLPARTRKTVSVTFSWPGNEGGTVSLGVGLSDRTPYHRVDEQGGRELEMRSADEELANLREEPLHGEPRTILSARGTLSGSPRSFDVPVDSSVSRLVVSVEVGRGAVVALVRPGGAAVNASHRDVTAGRVEQVEIGRATVANRQVFTATAPETGVWRVEVSDTGTSGPSMFAVAARGDSRVGFDNFEFVRKQEGVHGGYFSLDGMPLAGAPAIGRARLSEAPGGAAFRAVDEMGVTLQALALKNDDPDSLPDLPVGQLALPAVPFSIVMNATDAAGAPIQRQYPAVFRGQTVAVSFDFGLPDGATLPKTSDAFQEQVREMMAPARFTDVIAAGSSRRFRFIVTNLGAATTTFALTARASLGDVRDLSPRTAALAPGASATAAFSLAIPENAPEGDRIELRLAAQSASDAALTNSASVELGVAYANDLDGDSVNDGVDNCPGVPNGDQIDADRDTTGDACDPTPATPVSITSIKPATGPVGTTVVISGTAFGSTPAQNTVTFGGVPATIVSASPNELIVTVPAGATSAPIAVTCPQGWAPSRVPFVIVASTAPPSSVERPRQ